MEVQVENEDLPTPPIKTFMENLHMKLQTLDKQAKSDDHVAAKKLEIDIKELILDKQLKDQIIRNQPVANLAMLFELLG